MNNWQADNARYLAAALEWVRLRLKRLSRAEPAPTPATPPAKSTSLVERFFNRVPEPSEGALPALPSAPPKHAMDEQIARAAAEMDQAELQMQPLPALALLGQQLGLSRFERDILLLCAAMELDPSLPVLCARAHGHPHPTFALALILFDDPEWEALAPGRPLRYWRLIEINQPGAQPLTTSALRADERIVNYLKGLNVLDDRLALMLTPMMEADGLEDLPPSQEEAVQMILHRWQPADAGPTPVAQLAGPDPASKHWVAARAAAALGRELLALSAENLPTSAPELETLARLWGRESRLLPVALYLDAHEPDALLTESGLGRFLARAEGALFLSVREGWPTLRRAHFTVEVAKPTMMEQQTVWAEALGAEAHPLSGSLAAQFNLNLPTIEQVAREALAETNAADALDAALWRACCEVTRPRLDALAQRLEPKATWEDLVLPAEPLELLRGLTAQVRERHTVYEVWEFARKMNRGLGITALFAGESGTGKTMAAEVIANDLRLNLYRIDLSAVVSKYIGETEKNLRRLFDAAEDGGAILFFDEADALFGKRSEVKDSHDRYANIEVNYLLQRMEAYRGLAILATNMKSALDPAFMRRLRFSVNFPFPGVAERVALWANVFPPATPKENLDVARLARLDLTGGNIHSVALNAAFLAAQDGGVVTMPLALAAARAEFRKLGKPMNESDFRVM